MSGTTGTPAGAPPTGAHATPTPPKRGGIHKTFGIYVGGGPLNDKYELEDPITAYRFSSQRRHPKTISYLESDLKQARDSTTTIKFNGSLEVEAGNSSEISKDRFQDLLEEKVDLSLIHI